MFGKNNTKLILVGIWADRLVGMHVEIKSNRVFVIDYLPILDISRCFREGILFDYDLLADLLTYEIEKMSIKTKDIVLGVWLSSSESKLVHLTRMDDRELGKYVDIEYSKAFSGRDNDRFVFDYERVGSSVMNGDVMDVINLVSVSKEDIKGILTSFQQRKFNVLCVDDLSNSMKYTFKSTLDNLLAIWVTSSRSFMMYYDRGDVLYTRTLDVGYGNLGDSESMSDLSSDQVENIQKIYTGILESVDYIKSYFKVADLSSFSVVEDRFNLITNELMSGFDFDRSDRDAVIDGNTFVVREEVDLIYDLTFSLSRRFVK